MKKRLNSWLKLTLILIILTILSAAAVTVFAYNQEVEEIELEIKIARLETEVARTKEEKALRFAKELEDKERILNTDLDRDGLTYREEMALGISDSNQDSDNDGIPDSLDAHPAGGDRKIPQHFKWYYNKTEWNWTYSIYEDWYEFYKNLPGQSSVSGYVTYYDPFIQKIAGNLKSTAEEKDYNLTHFIISFIQGLPYVRDAYTGHDEYFKYPIETFVERNGDCEDTSYLAASLLIAAGRDTVLIALPNHMAIGVWADSEVYGTYYELEDRRYYYLETTGEGWRLGEIPNEYRNAYANLIQISSGETTIIYPKYQTPSYSN